MPSNPPLAQALDPTVARTLHLDGGSRVRRFAVRAALVLAAALAALAIGRWWHGRGVVSAPAYVTAPVTRGPLAVTVGATGTLEARNQVTIGSEISGRIARVLVDANDRVTRGQVLAEIDPELLAAQVEQASAALASARAQLASARASADEATLTRARVDELTAAGAAATAEREGATAAALRGAAAVQLAAAAVRQAEASLRLARTNLARTAVRAPIDGVVLSREVEVGQTVVASFQAPVLFQIAEDLRAMRASVDVDEADVGLVREGQEVTFTVAAYVGRTFTARVATVHNAARLVDRVVTYEAELEVDNPDLALRPGMTVTAELVARRVPTALLVPAAALRYAPADAPPAAGKRVWIVRGGLPVAVAVELLGENDTLAAIAAPGLPPDAAVIVNTR